jgi:5-methylcytosine-specific restriction endonuclease McrA
MSWGPYWPSDRETRERAAKRRSERLAAAKIKGTHTKSQWTALADVFGHCVCCGIPYEDLYGNHPTRDHIEPLFCGGCDCIGNLQPVCRNCNSSNRITGDMRNQARPGWVKFYLARLEYGWT